MPLLLRFSCPVEEIRNKLKGFIEDFYTYDFTDIMYKEDSDDESDFEIDIEKKEEESEGPSENKEKAVVILD